MDNLDSRRLSLLILTTLHSPQSELEHPNVTDTTASPAGALPTASRLSRARDGRLSPLGSRCSSPSWQLENTASHHLGADLQPRPELDTPGDGACSPPGRSLTCLQTGTFGPHPRGARRAVGARSPHFCEKEVRTFQQAQRIRGPTGYRATLAGGQGAGRTHSHSPSQGHCCRDVAVTSSSHSFVRSVPPFVISFRM